MMMMHSYFSLSLSSSSSSSLLPLKPRRRAQHHASYGHGHGRPSLPPFTPSCLPPSSARAASVTEANLPQPPPSPEPNPNASPNPNPNPNPNPEKSWKGRGSSSLSRWARARRLRSSPSSLLQPSVSFSPLTPATDARPSPSPPANDVDFDDEDELQREGTEKTIFMISDGTGWTAEHSVSAALGQFEYCLVDRGCPINTHLFSQINDVDRMIEIVRNAGEDNAIVLFTLADPAMADAARRACQLMGVPYVDILGPILDVLSLHLGVTPSGLPRGAPGRKRALSKDYFKRIEAVEFTIKQDDGALPKNLHKADIVLVGVSRTSKTPLSTYIAQKGYKVANVPLVLGIDPPKELFEINQSKIYALTIDPNFLQSIRIARRRSLGISSGAFYSDMSHIRDELEYSRDLFLRNPTWPVIEVTGKAIEETASVILRIYHDSKQKYAMPRISKRY